MKLWRKLRLIYPGNATIEPSKLYGEGLEHKQEIINKHGSVTNFLFSHYRKLLTISSVSLGRDPTEQEKRTFSNMEYLIQTDDNIKRMYDNWGDDYVHGIYYSKITPLNIKADNYDPLKSKKKDESKISTHFRYISTELDLSKHTFKRSMKQYVNIKEKCWINMLYNFSKTGNVITRKNIFELIDNINDKVKVATQKQEQKHKHIANECFLNTLYDLYRDNLLSSDKKDAL